ncbi:DUF7927 domain-containing protein [Actinocatenispora rupis]|uniref:Gram-positive cocci surface proteins LPxTG domain-containing protein n=1 Tax=Actinocatenispora rupis TaxID=519421 RepID=A0A8J3NHT8_9ACTN|nr:DUF11 domain-containing protein [Actinocatenispora rupis]GID16394.1 hypothetical protein Aru02nite_72830 [Actinocatenispora rupis]
MRRGLALIGAAVVVAAAVAGFGAPAEATVVRPFQQEYHENVYGDFLQAGNAVLGCPPADTRCAAAQQRTTSAGNNSFAMQYVNAAPGLGGVNSSVAQLTVPPGATVAYAILLWGGDLAQYRLGRGTLKRCDASHPDATVPSGSPDSHPVRVRIGTGAAASVTPTRYSEDPAADSGPHYYTAESVVTGAFASVPTGSPVRIAVGDIWAPQGYGCVGGWSLTLVYRYPSANATYAPVKRAVYAYAGHVLQRSKDTPTTVRISGFRAADLGDVRAGVTAYEGDWNVPGSRFAINGTLIPEPGTGDRTKFFNSSTDGAVDPDVPNNMSVDAKAFTIPRDVIRPGSSSATLTFSTSGDTYLAQQLAFSVPVPDIDITKRADVTRAGPGDRVTYTVTIRNVGGAAHPDVRYTDDLADVLDDASYRGDAEADGGRVTSSGGVLTWAGAVPVGATYHVKYSVVVHDPLSGDRRMRNAVVTDDPTVSCPAGATDPGCAVTVALHRTTGGGTSGGGTGGGTLPTTGSRYALVAGLGLALVGVGVALTVLVRRRRA